MSGVTEVEFSHWHIGREFLHLDTDKQSSTKAADSQQPGPDTTEHLTPEREAEILQNLREIIDSELDYTVEWRLPNGERVKV